MQFGHRSGRRALSCRYLEGALRCGGKMRAWRQKRKGKQKRPGFVGFVGIGFDFDFVSPSCLLAILSFDMNRDD